MAHAIIIGDGPSGLSAALFLAKNGVRVTVFGQGKTNMNFALLYNYLGIGEMLGTDFIAIAREQAANFGASLEMKTAAAIEQAESGFRVITADGETHAADFVILAEGKAAKLATALGLAKNDSGVVVDRDGRTAVPGLYAVGRMTRRTRSQAIISAGEGAAAALDILAQVHGKEFNDFDEPPKEGQ